MSVCYSRQVTLFQKQNKYSISSLGFFYPNPNPTEIDSTQLKSSQVKSTQLNSTQLKPPFHFFNKFLLKIILTKQTKQTGHVDTSTSARVSSSVQTWNCPRASLRGPHENYRRPDVTLETLWWCESRSCGPEEY